MWFTKEFVYGKEGEFHYSCYNRTSIFIKNISLVEKETHKSAFATKILEMRLSMNAYDLIFKDHNSLSDKKLHLLIPYLRVVINHNLLLMMEVVDALTGINKTKAKETSKENERDKDKGKGKDKDTDKGKEKDRDRYEESFEPIYLASDDQINDLRDKLSKLKKEHQSKQKHCQHCVLRFKKSKSITNVFIGDLGVVDENFSQTTFADLYDYEMNTELEHYNSGFSLTIQNTKDHAPNPVGEISWRVPFLSLTQDIGVFKKNLMVHICPSSSPGPFQDLEFEKLNKSGDILTELNSGVRKKRNVFDIVPSISADDNFLRDLDDNFWKYFRAQEKKNFDVNAESDSGHGNDTIPSRKLNSELNYFERLKAYVLVMHKQNCFKELLKEFEVKESNEYKTNKFLFRVDQITLHLATNEDFVAIFNMINTFGYLSKWFGEFRRDFVFREEITQPATEQVSKKSPPKPIKFDINGLVRSECVRFAIQQINFRILNSDILEFFVRDVSFENLKELHPEGHDLKETVTLLSVEAVGFTAKDVSSGSFDGIGLNYEPSTNCLSFFVRNISYEANVKENKSNEIDTKKTDPKSDPFKATRSRTAIHIPDLGVESNLKKKDPAYLNKEDIIGVSVSLIFNPETHKLEQVIAMVAGKIGVTISDVDISDLLNMISVFACLYVDENNRVMDELKYLSFDSERFKEVDELMWKRKMELKARKLHPILSDTAQSKTATGKTDPIQQEGNVQQVDTDIILSATIEGVVISFAKKQEVFLKIALNDITATNNPEEIPVGYTTMVVNVASVNLNPLIGKTIEMVTPLMVTPLMNDDDSKRKNDDDLKRKNDDDPKRKNFMIQLTLKDGKPYVLVKNVKVTFLNRVITELEYLQKELKLKIKKLNETVSERKKNKHPDPPKSTEEKFLVGLKVKNCSVWLQRNSSDEDGIFVTTKGGSITVTLRSDDIMFPASLTPENYKIVGPRQRQIVDFETEAHGMTLMKTVRVVNAKVSLEEIWAQYSIKHKSKGENDRDYKYPKERVASFFHADNVEVDAVAPDTPGQLNEWSFDANISVDLGNFSLFCNLATLDEIKEIVDDNLKEQSTLYDFNKGSLERVNISLDGDASVVMDKFVIKPEKLP